MKINKIIEKLIENWSAKVLSFAFALVLVQFYKSSLLERRYFSVPLVVENTGSLVSSTAIPRMVKVSVWGEVEGISAIREDDIVAFIDFASISDDGEHTLPIQTRRRGIALNVSPLEIDVEPTEIKLNLEKSMTKRATVKLGLRGEPAQNYEIYETIITPSVVEVIGPTSVVDNITDVFTNPIKIENRQTSFSGTTEILSQNSLVTISGSQQINYSIKIREISEAKTFDDLELYFNGLDDKFEIVSNIPKGNLTVRGERSKVLTWKIPANTLRVDCSNIKKPGVYSLPVSAIVHGMLDLIDANPKNIQIEIKERQTEDPKNE